MVAIMGGFYLLQVVTYRIERKECLEWQIQAREYPLWYSQNWQRAQCNTLGMPLPR